MKIRAFCDKDYPRILEIYANSKLDELRFEEKTFELLPLDQDKKRLPPFKESDIFVYDDEGILGYGSVFGSEIRALFVCPSARGQGVGKAIFEFLLSRIDGKSNLFIAKTNTPAKMLYEAYGFEVTKEFQTEYNGVHVVVNEMVRP